MSATIIERVHDVIYDPRRGLKTGRRTWAVEVINEVIRDLSQENRAGFILGCTEFSLISKEFKESNPDILIVDPFDCLVSALGWSQS